MLLLEGHVLLAKSSEIERWELPGSRGHSWLSPGQGWKDPEFCWRGSWLFQLPAAHDVHGEEKQSLLHLTGMPRHPGGVLWGNDLRLARGLAFAWDEAAGVFLSHTACLHR